MNTKPRGRPRGPVTVVYKRRVLPEKVNQLDVVLGRAGSAVLVPAVAGIVPVESGRLDKLESDLKAMTDCYVRAVSRYEQAEADNVELQKGLTDKAYRALSFKYEQAVARIRQLES